MLVAIIASDQDRYFRPNYVSHVYFRIMKIYFDVYQRSDYCFYYFIASSFWKYSIQIKYFYTVAKILYTTAKSIIFDIPIMVLRKNNFLRLDANSYMRLIRMMLHFLFLVAKRHFYKRHDLEKNFLCIHFRKYLWE